jgi:large subunit ribosomal protein L24
MDIKKGDNVMVTKGKDRGKSGKVIRIDFDKSKVTVQGVNVFKKHARPKKQGEKGEVVDITKPFSISNIALICANCGKAVRVGHRVAAADKKKVRFCKKCDSVT